MVTAPMLLCRSNEVNGYQRPSLSLPLSLSLSLHPSLVYLSSHCRIVQDHPRTYATLFQLIFARPSGSVLNRWAQRTPLRDTLWRRARLERYLSPIFDTGIRDRWALSLSLHRSALPPSSFAGPLSEGRTNEVWVFDGLLEGDRMTIMRNKTSPKESLGRLGSETIWY